MAMRATDKADPLAKTPFEDLLHLRREIGGGNQAFVLLCKIAIKRCCILYTNYSTIGVKNFAKISHLFCVDIKRQAEEFRERSEVIEEVGSDSGTVESCAQLDALFSTILQCLSTDMEALHRWFGEVQRPFPWRTLRTPYRVWISEVMLQQTRTSVVVPYFERWMALFPDVKTLAKAPILSVIKAWEGLGYYSRARNLHRAAQILLAEWGGEIPSTREALLQIPGIGPYTVGAILSFGFQKRAAAVDGNVLRVLSRYLLIEESIDIPRTRTEIERRAQELLDKEFPWVTAEALIELGATVCTPKPRCEACPLSPNCRARRENRAEELPCKRPRAAIISLTHQACVVEAADCVLLQKASEGVMADLYEFPHWEGGRLTPRRLLAEVEARLGCSATYLHSLSRIQYHFTQYKVTLYPHCVALAAQVPLSGYEWIPRSQLGTLPFSSGHRRLLQQWQQR